MSKAKKIAIICDDSGNISGTNLSGTNTGDQVIPVASSTIPANLGTAAIGTSITFARADHVHEIPILSTLTFGAGLSGTSYNTSSAVTIAIDSTVTTLTGSQTLTNKTLTSPVVTTSLTTGSTTFNLLNTTATTINFGSAATAITIGDTSHTGITSIQHDLYVYGNITFGGGSTQLSATQLVIDDPLIYIGSNNTADIIDLGIIGAYNNGAHLHTGLVRDASDSVWKLFSGMTSEPSSSTVDFTGVTYAPLKVGNLEYTGTLTGSTGILNIGSGQVYKDASGNVGIGTSSLTAGYKLDVVQSSAINSAARFRINDAHTTVGYNYGVMLQNIDATVNNYTTLSNMDSTGASNAWIEFTNISHSATTPQGAIGFNTRNGTNYLRKMTIDMDGNVGIGTGTYTTYGKLTVTCSGTGRANGLSITPSGDISDGLRLYCDGTNNPNGIIENVWDTSGSTLFRDILINPSGGNVGIGTSSPAYKLNIVDQANAGFGFYENNDADGPVFRCFRTRGTTVAPTAVQSGDVLAALRGFGYTSAGAYSVSTATLNFYAAESFTATAQGSYIALATTPTGTTTQTERMRITSAGGISFGSSGTAYGTSGQVLLSAGNAAPVWTNQSSIAAGTASNITAYTINQNVGTANAVQHSDITTARAASLTTGYVYYGNTATKYAGFDGTNFVSSMPMSFNILGSSTSCTGNAATAGGLAVATGVNNVANQIVRTNGSGYLDTGWINTVSGDSGIANRLTRIYASHDAYVRYLSLLDFKVSMGLSGKNNYSRRIDYSADANYHVGSMGHAGIGLNEVFHGGSGFIDSWGGTNSPAGHVHGFNALHYTANSYGTTGGNAYGIQVVGSYGDGGLLYSRGCSGGTFSAWRTQIDSVNIANQSVNSATTATNQSGGTVSATTGTFSGSLSGNGNIIINNGSPTLYFQDTNEQCAMLHNNSNLLYILRGGINTLTWSTVGSGSWPMVVNLTNNDVTWGGNISAIYNITAYASDKRLKENIVEIPNAIEKIKKIRGVTFDWNDISETHGFIPQQKYNDVGVIAQEIEEVLPQVVTLAPFDTWIADPDTNYTPEELEEKSGKSKSGENYKTVQYDRIVPLLIQAIKEQQIQIDELKEIINKGK